MSASTSTGRPSVPQMKSFLLLFTTFPCDRMHSTRHSACIRPSSFAMSLMRSLIPCQSTNAKVLLCPYISNEILITFNQPALRDPVLPLCNPGSSAYIMPLGNARRDNVFRLFRFYRSYFNIIIILICYALVSINKRVIYRDRSAEQYFRTTRLETFDGISAF